jgi:hypothetical protein
MKETIFSEERQSRDFKQKGGSKDLTCQSLMTPGLVFALKSLNPVFFDSWYRIEVD